MLTRLKQYFWIAVVIAFFYFLLSHHLVFFSFTSFKTLKKDELTFRYTFYNLAQNTPEAALKVDRLREAGIGDLMLNRGMISEEKLTQLIRSIESEQ